jgi:hypothetical protein
MMRNASRTFSNMGSGVISVRKATKNEEIGYFKKIAD